MSSVSVHGPSSGVAPSPDCCAARARAESGRPSMRALSSIFRLNAFVESSTLFENLVDSSDASSCSLLKRSRSSAGRPMPLCSIERIEASTMRRRGSLSFS